MADGDKPKCDIDDLMCQMQALNYLDGLENLLGTEKFQERYPEFKELGELVKERMGEQRTTIKEMIEHCGMLAFEDKKREVLTETDTILAEE